ncbi:TetR/AcrR family transcriptional regulator [Actinocorallia sp. API 0066]|uniref:TetR/AcrR family transcriptional regulator n=1 Tax=Actinocorallia sp. API 0066 TaxID=2896846 RepID=UPI001E2CEE31|nr:TetR/AcrR family transcriptional regulator [Actinocorallia sp. API 0066]MCD0451874.1 TetR/AcrR family transcriptional regulator [Actinocorallia sp. API 0066]
MARDARRRILDTAARLFYGEGVHTVGIDRIIAEAGVAKATFYHHFKSKDALVCAYLTAHFDGQRAEFATLPGTGRAKLEAVFARIAEVCASPGFRGCAFLNAAAEFADPAHPARGVVAEYRAWFRSLMRRLLAEEGHPDPEAGSRLLLLLRDATAVSGALDPPDQARETTEAALDRLLTA